MNRPGRVAGRARVTSYGTLATKLSKSSFIGISDRSKRKTVTPRTLKNRSGEFVFRLG